MSLALVRGIYRWPVIFPHKGTVTRKMFPFDDGIMNYVVQKDTVTQEVAWDNSALSQVETLGFCRDFVDLRNINEKDIGNWWEGSL